METQDAHSGKTLSTLLIGTWELLSREDNTLGGERRVDPALGADPIALLIFDKEGHFAAQFMKRDRNAAVETDSALIKEVART